MSAASEPAGRRFAYRAMKASGEEIRDVLRARDRQEALTRLAGQKLIVTELREANDNDFGLTRRGAKRSERVLVLRQLAVMIGAGVDLLEALDTVAAAFGEGPTAVGLRITATALRRGDRIAKALAEGLPGYPPYVYALIAAGESSGQLDRVLEEAAQQIAFEDRIARDVTNALTYPAFLVVAGLSAIGFLFYAVVPRFAEMVASQQNEITGASRFVLDLGVAFHDNAPLILAAAAAIAVAIAAALASAAGRAAAGRLLEATPGLNALVAARQRTRWARIMAFAIGAGVGLLEAANLALLAAPQGKFRDGLAGATRALRAGKSVDASFSGALAPIDLSLLRVGQRTGRLADMFRVVADRHEENLRDALKRVTSLVEPVAIGFVAIAIASIVLSLVTAMTSLYDSIG